MNNMTRTHFLGQQKVDSVAGCIGATPLVPLNHIPAFLAIEAQVYANPESFNPCGFVKTVLVNAWWKGQNRIIPSSVPH
jgi:hypothetical protein